MGQVQSQHQQQRDQHHGEQGQDHVLPGMVVVVHPRPCRAADGAPAFGDRSGALGADQVLAAHLLVPPGRSLPGQFDDVGRSKPVSPLDCPVAKLGRELPHRDQSATRRARVMGP